MSFTDAPATEQREGHPVDSWASKGYQGVQPWDHEALGVADKIRELEPGEENTVAPRVSHNYPVLTSGSTHPAVHELGRKLAKLGFPNSVSRGENPFGAVDNSIIQAVDAFRSQYGVEEDPSGFGGNHPEGRRHAAAHIGPWTIEGILKAHERETEQRR